MKLAGQEFTFICILQIGNKKSGKWEDSPNFTVSPWMNWIFDPCLLTPNTGVFLPAIVIWKQSISKYKKKKPLL